MDEVEAVRQTYRKAAVTAAEERSQEDDDEDDDDEKEETPKTSPEHQKFEEVFKSTDSFKNVAGISYDREDSWEIVGASNQSSDSLVHKGATIEISEGEISKLVNDPSIIDYSLIPKNDGNKPLCAQYTSDRHKLSPKTILEETHSKSSDDDSDSLIKRSDSTNIT